MVFLSRLCMFIHFEIIFRREFRSSATSKLELSVINYCFKELHLTCRRLPEFISDFLNKMSLSSICYTFYTVKINYHISGQVIKLSVYSSGLPKYFNIRFNSIRLVILKVYQICLSNFFLAPVFSQEGQVITNTSL